MRPKFQYISQYIMQFNKISTMWAVISGCLLTVAFPSSGIYQTAWFALVPLLFSIRNSSVKDSMILGFITGFIYYITLLYWIIPTMNKYGGIPFILCLPILILLALYMACYIAFFTTILVRLCKGNPLMLFIAPFLWVSTEYLRSYLLSGFPWSLLGYSQVKLTTLIQIADITGIYGLSFIVILANIVVFTIILWLTNKQWQGKNIKKKDCMIFLLILLLIITGVYFYGKQRIQSVGKQVNNAVKTKIAVIQGNIDQTHKWDTSFQVSLIEKYIRLSQEAKNADLIVWPETAIPFYYSHDEALTKLVNDGIKKCNAWFILGSPSFKRDKENIKYFNSAFLVDPNENVHGRYDKYHLVPFGEYVPFRKYFPFLGKIVAQVGDFSSGLEGHALKWENNKLGIQTCFEIIFPNLSRAIVKNGAGIIINITNDAWFGYSSAPYQHFSMAVFRAIENRRVLVRAANTGISGFIDPVGRVISITKLFKEAVVTNTVPMLYKLSLYTRFGDFFTIACIIITLTVILFNSDLWDKLKVHLKTKK